MIGARVKKTKLARAAAGASGARAPYGFANLGLSTRVCAPGRKDVGRPIRPLISESREREAAKAS